MTRRADKLTAVVLSGGGARAAYQVGLLRCVAEMAPEFRFPIITGVSAGAVNAAFLAGHQGGIAQATEDLCRLWSRLEVARILRTGPMALAWNVARWVLRLLSGGARLGPEVRSLLDPAPLAQLLAVELAAVDGELASIARNLEAGALRAVALTTLDYHTGRSCTWVQGCDIQPWERPDRTSLKTRLTVAFRFMTRGLGTREMSSSDFLSLLMFQPDYIAQMIEIGVADARRHYDEIARLLMG